MKTIDPYLPSGFRDYLPAEALLRSKMFGSIEKTFETFGFRPIDTPRIEREAVLTGGDENFDKQIFKIADRNDADPLALRFDLTVPLARFVALHRNDLSFPFKRYQIGMVWRAEHAQAGRYREFTQCDADIIGSKSSLADAEIIALTYHALRAIGVERFVINVNHRGFVSDLVTGEGVSSDALPQVLRIVDKYGKQTEDSLRDELKEEFGDAAVRAFSKLIEAEPDSSVSSLLKTVSELGVPEDFVSFKPTIVRGLGYYTGMVFETELIDLPSIGSVCSGGRYDNLISRFGGAEISGVGMSIGIDRLFAALKELGISTEGSSPVSVSVLHLDGADEQAMRVATALRNNGISTEIYLGSEDNLKGQLTYAIKNGYRVAVIIGSDEAARSVAQVKDLTKRTQEEVPFEVIPEFIKKLLD